MFESIINFFRKLGKNENKESKSKQTAKDRLHLVLMQDRANVSADFLEMMKQEIIEVIKKYIEVDEKEIDVRLTNEVKEDGTTGAPSLYANIPIMKIKNEMKKNVEQVNKEEVVKEESKENNEKTTDSKVEETKNEEENSSRVEKPKTEESNNEEIKTEETSEENKNQEDKPQEEKTECKEEKVVEENNERSENKKSGE